MKSEIYSIPEYSMRYVKEKILDYRRTNKYVGMIEIHYPIEAENSVGFLKKNYPADTVTFRISLEVKEKQILIKPNVV